MCFSCPICGKTIRTVQGVRDHEIRLNHIPPYGLMPRTCQLCSYVFAEGEKCRPHNRSDHGENCRICGKRVMQGQGIDQHTKDKHGDSLSLMERVQYNLQPDRESLRRSGYCVDKVSRALRINSCQIFGNSIEEIVKGGSLKKGTALRQSDIDLVIFLNGYSSFDEFIGKLPSHLNELEAFFKQRPSVGVFQGKTMHSIEILVDGQKMDLLPTFNILNKKTPQGVYKEMRRNPRIRSFYSAALVKLQIEFVNSAVQQGGQKLQALIRFVKDWKRENVGQHSRYRFPPSYYYELVTIDCWQRAGKPGDFNTDKGLRSVMESLKNCDSQRILFDDYYKKSDASAYGNHYVIGPANPFNDLTETYSGWDSIKRRAADYIETKLKSVSLKNCWR